MLSNARFEYSAPTQAAARSATNRATASPVAGSASGLENAEATETPEAGLSTSRAVIDRCPLTEAASQSLSPTMACQPTHRRSKSPVAPNKPWSRRPERQEHEESPFSYELLENEAALVRILHPRGRSRSAALPFTFVVARRPWIAPRGGVTGEACEAGCRHDGLMRREVSVRLELDVIDPARLYPAGGAARIELRGGRRSPSLGGAPRPVWRGAGAGSRGRGGSPRPCPCRRA